MSCPNEVALLAWALVEPRVAFNTLRGADLSEQATELLEMIRAHGAACRAIGLADYAATVFGVTNATLELALAVDDITVAELAAEGFVDEVLGQFKLPTSPVLTVVRGSVRGRQPRSLRRTATMAPASLRIPHQTA